MRTLVIVESPAKTKTVAKYLGDGYTVTSSIGHIRDLPKSNKNAIDIAGGFVPNYEVLPTKKKVVIDLVSYASKSDRILLATDPDREGEAISWHIYSILKEKLGNKLPKIERITFNEITKNAINEAVEHPRQIDDNLRHAQEARRVLDRIFGYDLSALIWKKVRYGLSAGRVQSPALRILCEREREIKKFIPETYWVLEALCKTLSNAEIKFTCKDEPRDKKVVDNIEKIARTGNWFVADVKESEQKRSPRAPFTTSTLQQTASTRLGFSPSKTMQVAQKLYESGYITYMRTDSPVLSKDAQGSICGYIEKKYGKDMMTARNFTAKSKNAQEAHEAIRPSDVTKLSQGATEEQKRLYKLIWERTVASQMADAKLLKTKITASVEGHPTFPEFVANGSRTLFSGWMTVDQDGASEDVELPKVAVDETLKLKNLDILEKQTEPPNRYSEAGLVKELESRGIGRPSTYAAIIRTLEERGYVEKLGRSLKPTDTGEVVSHFVETHFTDYISDTFTAKMEDTLDDIADGSAEYKKTLTEFYEPFHKAVESKETIPKITTLGDANEQFKCPKCESLMVIKLGKNGTFLSCSRYPDCDGALLQDGTRVEAEAPIGIDPETKQPIFVMVGKFGPYVQLGTRDKTTKIKPKMASLPKGADPKTVTLSDALRYLTIPRNLGEHPDTGKPIMASVGRFGPYIGHDGDFRSLKLPDNVYDITFERALEILREPKKPRGFQRKPKKTE